MWISIPTPVTKSSQIEESGSSRNPASTLKEASVPSRLTKFKCPSPLPSHVYTIFSKGRPEPCAKFVYSKTVKQAKRNASTTTPTQTALTVAFCSRRPEGREERDQPDVVKKEHVVSRRSLVVSYSSFAFRCSLFAHATSEQRTAVLLPFQQINLIHIDRLFIPEEGDQNAEARGGFGGSVYYDKDREQLPMQVSPHARERYQVQVYRIQDQFDRHQHNHHVAACKHTDHTQHEECRRNDEIVERSYRDHSFSCS